MAPRRLPNRVLRYAVAVLLLVALGAAHRTAGASQPAVGLIPASGPPGTKVSAIGTFGPEAGRSAGCDIYQVRWDGSTVVATAVVQPAAPAGTPTEAAFHVSFAVPRDAAPGLHVLAFVPVPDGSAEPDPERCPGVEASFTVGGGTAGASTRPHSIVVSVDHGDGGSYFIGDQVAVCVIWDQSDVAAADLPAFLITPMPVRISDLSARAVLYSGILAPRMQKCMTQTAMFPSGQRMVQADLAPDGATALATATATFTVSTNAAPIPVRTLSRGCSNITPTVTESVTSFTARISPQSALIALWEFSGSNREFAGWFALPGAPADLTTVTRLRPVYICLRAPATLMQPPN